VSLRKGKKLHCNYDKSPYQCLACQSYNAREREKDRGKEREKVSLSQLIIFLVL
jgi:hypothetical protein